MENFNKTKGFIPGVPHHIYFRSFDRGLIFYTSSDYLVYFTFITTVARHYGVTLMELSIMPDHVHAFARSRKSMDMKLFLFQTERPFAMEYNSAIGRTGRLPGLSVQQPGGEKDSLQGRVDAVEFHGFRGLGPSFLRTDQT